MVKFSGAPEELVILLVILFIAQLLVLKKYWEELVILLIILFIAQLFVLKEYLVLFLGYSVVGKEESHYLYMKRSILW